MGDTSKLANCHRLLADGGLDFGWKKRCTMKNLTLRDNLFEDLFDARREFDQVFNRILTVNPWAKHFNFVPAIETHIDKEAKKYICKVSLPGIDPKEVQITMQGNLLTVAGERKTEKTTKELDYFHEEFAYGKFERTWELPEGITTDKINAEFVNGVLEITAPIKAVALPRKIEIRATPMTKQVAA
jgi:HSP20 family protein